MTVVIYVLLILVGLLALLATTLLIAELRVVNRLAEVNKQLLILVAGKETKPEAALRALVASDRPPKKILPGIAGGKKKKAADKESGNTDFKMSIGVE